jgi:vancomycin resistance protein VanW
VQVAVRRLAAPVARRLRREVQWRRSRTWRRLPRSSSDLAPFEAARHATPLLRPLAGLDPELQRNKRVNLALAASCLDGLVLAPGASFSFWRHVGRPTRRRGFLDGLVLDHGRMAAGVGGGMCQLTNLLYWMTLHTPLTVTERWRHTFDVFPDAGRTQPFGSGATCAWPVLDLQIVNRTALTFRLSVRVTADHLEGSWSADHELAERYEVYEAHHMITNDAPGVFHRHNVLRRRTFDAGGAVVADELVAANQGLLRYQPFIGSGH